MYRLNKDGVLESEYSDDFDTTEVNDVPMTERLDDIENALVELAGMLAGDE